MMDPRALFAIIPGVVMITLIIAVPVLGWLDGRSYERAKANAWWDVRTAPAEKEPTILEVQVARTWRHRGRLQTGEGTYSLRRVVIERIDMSGEDWQSLLVDAENAARERAAHLNGMDDSARLAEHKRRGDWPG